VLLHCTWRETAQQLRHYLHNRRHLPLARRTLVLEQSGRV
jgi:hypothetical protein